MKKPPTLPLEDLLDVKQAAKKLCLSEWYLRELVRRGEFVHTRFGRKILFHPQHVQDFIAAKTRAPHAKGA